MYTKSYLYSKNRYLLALVSYTLTAKSSQFAYLKGHSIDNLPLRTLATKVENRDQRNIPSKVHKLIKFAFFTLKDFTYFNFLKKLNSLFLSNKTYSLYLRLSFSTGSEFRMVGRQVGFQGSDKFDKVKTYNLYDTLLDKIKLSIHNYDFLGDIDGIEISYFEIDILPELKIQKPSKLNSIPKRLVNKKELGLNFSNNILPLTLDEKYYGEKIENKDKLNIFNLIKNNLDSEQLIDQININLEDRLFKYKAPNSKDKYYIIVVSKTGHSKHVFNFINGNHILSALDYKKDDVNGLILFDRVINNTTLSIAVKSKENKRAIESNILKSSIQIQLSPITKKVNNYTISFKKQLKPIMLEQRNIKFGTFDLETFVDTDYNSKVYAAGFITYLEHMSEYIEQSNISNSSISNKYNDTDTSTKLGYAHSVERGTKLNNLFYLSDFKDSNNLLLTCINSMLIPKYHNYIFYCHNFGNYDLYFLYSVLEEYNQQYRKNKKRQSEKEVVSSEKELNNYYNINLTFRSDQVIKLDLKIKYINPKTNNESVVKLTFLDSLNILSGSLEQLAKDYKVQTQKGKFPYSFVNKDNLNYQGQIPSIKHFNGISQSEYNQILNSFSGDIWDLKKETLIYLKKDLISLLEILNEFSKILYFKFNLNITEGMTISRLALNLFLKRYLPDIPKSVLLLKPESKVIPLINKNHMFNFIYDAYYGGITEVYRPHGINLKGIDVNSLYPYAALNPMPGSICSYIESYNSNSPLNLDNLFGFFYAKVKTNNLYLGLLPVRTKTGLIFPNGEFEGTWSSEELKFARDQGYEIKVIKGYNFNKVENIFTDYVLDLYNIKKESTGSIKNVSKSLLNNVIGRFGLNIFKPLTKIVNEKERDYITATRLVKSHKVITNNQFLITYLPGLNKEICFEHGINPTDFFNKEQEDLVTLKYGQVNLKSGSNTEYLATFKDVSIAISAMVNSYARIFMHKIKLDIINAGGIIYYSDTDSIFYNNYTLPDHFIGPNLGQFKVEYTNIEGYFISNKTYCLILEEGGTIIKAKGVMNESLNLEDFKNMYLSQLNIKAFKSDTFKSFELATVNLNKKEIILKYDSYTKRTKIFDTDPTTQKGLWINTIPLILPLKNNEI